MKRRRQGVATACTLIIMAKEPVMGRVKTRLAREVGAVEAMRFYRAALRTVVGRLARDRRWRTLLAVTPDTATGARCWPRGDGVIGQRRGDLGQRMQRLLAYPHSGRVVVIGTDIPAVRPADIAAAFRLLGNHDAVFGPAEDGGFWLVGAKRPGHLAHPFAGVRWSHPQTLADTLRNLGSAKVALAARLADVDTARDLGRSGSLAARVVPPAGAGR